MYRPVQLPQFDFTLPTLLVRWRACCRQRWLRWAAIVFLIAAALLYELKTATLQSRYFAYYSSQLSYSLVAGLSPRIEFPRSGPFDERLGYKQLPIFLARLREAAYGITHQAHVSPALARTIRWGIAPPFREAPDAGLSIRGVRGSVIFDAGAVRRHFAQFDDIPHLVTQTLWFIENRELQNNGETRGNPVIEWHRLVKASLLYGANKLGFTQPVQGGSTLATQLEKFRHSPNGRTHSVIDKGRQIVAASLKAYGSGGDFSGWRHAVTVDYLNMMPLAAVPGYGEVHGLGEGLHAWFGMDLRDVSAALTEPGLTPAKAAAYKHVLALIVALRAPSHYLIRERDALERRTHQFARLLAGAGVIDGKLAQAVQALPLKFLASAPALPPASFVERKAINAVRANLLRILGISHLYDLDRLHLQVETSIDGRLQHRVGEFLQKLHRPDVIEALGLNQEPRLLAGVDPRKVDYSFLLFERTPAGNALRAQLDSRDQPFDLNRGVKLELGSTAKLRTLAHYLELVALLYHELAPSRRKSFPTEADSRRDPLSQWAAETLSRHKNIGLEEFLELALDRRYSASPYEAFFTGGGMHAFANFSASDNGRIFSVREALQWSTNLVFIRLMRDLVQFHQARLPYDMALLADPEHPLRRPMLEAIAEEESRLILTRTHKKYHELGAADLVKRFLGARADSPRYLAILFFAWSRARDQSDLAVWLERFMGRPVAESEIERLWRAYNNPRLNLADYGYLLSRNSLEVWGAGQLFHAPTITWNELSAGSVEARRVASAWLFKTRNQRAQNVRLRTRVEQDAFARMAPYWQRLGFPFDQLVPSYATAIGNSADQPTALAELMGIILNDGVKHPSLFLNSLQFAAGTPYETLLEVTPKPSERVLDRAVARALKGVLAGVVEQGTAQGVKNAFTTPGDAPVVIGGKTGSGDNRFETFSRYGQVLTSRATNRTATFAFYIGERYFGVITAMVNGPEASRYRFTSALPVALLKQLAPVIREDGMSAAGIRQRAGSNQTGAKSYPQTR